MPSRISVQNYHKKNVQKEFSRVADFVVNHLHDKIIFDDSRNPTPFIPKKVVLSLYLKWSKEDGKDVFITNNAKIQMALTN